MSYTRSIVTTWAALHKVAVTPAQVDHLVKTIEESFSGLITVRKAEAVQALQDRLDSAEQVIAAQKDVIAALRMFPPTTPDREPYSTIPPVKEVHAWNCPAAVYLDRACVCQDSSDSRIKDPAR